MKAYIHSFQGKPWNEDCEIALKGFNKLGVECILFKSNEELDERDPEDIVVGGMLMMGYAFDQAGIVPEIIDYPDELTDYLGRTIKTITLKDLQKQELPVFIKPVEEKTASGVVVNSLEDAEDYFKTMALEAEIYCSEVLNLVSEWRCFIRYREIIGVRHYNGDEKETCDKEIIKRAIRDYHNIPAACSLDFGVTEDGRTVLIEVNDGFAIGAYGLPDMEYAKFLEARWAELTEAEDPWKKQTRTGYVEAGISRIREQYLSAYASIEVLPKNGYEEISDCIKAGGKKVSFYGLKKILSECKITDIWLTDDIIQIEKLIDAKWFLQAVAESKNSITMHYCVSELSITQVENLMEEALIQETEDRWALFHWLQEDKFYVLSLRIRQERTETTIRLYEDGNGFVVYETIDNLWISYFGLTGETKETIMEHAIEKINHIVANPTYAHEDDRFFAYPIHMNYGLEWRYAEPEKMHEKDEWFESIDYEYDVNDNSLAKALVYTPEVSVIMDEIEEKRKNT